MREGWERNTQPDLQEVELLGEVEILLGQAALIVGAEGQREFVPADVDVGMVPCGLRQISHGVDEFDRRREILELVSAGDGVAGYSPIRRGRKRRIQRCLKRLTNIHLIARGLKNTL